MSILTEKQSILKQLRIFSSINDSLLAEENIAGDENIDALSLNTKDPFRFLIELIVTILGTQVLKKVINGLISSISDVESTIKEGIKSVSLNETSSQSLSSDSINEGFSFNIKDFDTEGKYRINPNSTRGKNIYGDNTNSFDHQFYAAIDNGSGSLFGLIDMNVNKDTGDANFKLNENAGSNKSEVINSFIDNIELINERKLFSELSDLLFGVFNNTKSRNELNNQSKENQLIQKIVNNPDDTVNYRLENTNPFETENETLNKINTNGRVFDMGCGDLTSTISENELNEFLNNGNKTAQGFEGLLNTGINNSRNSENTNDLNDSAIKDNFNKNLLDSIKFIIVKNTIFSTQFKFFFTLYNHLLSENVNVSINSFIEDNIEFIKCIIQKVINELSTKLFEFAKSELLKIITPVVIAIIKEKVNSYKNILLSLIGF